MLLNQSAHLFNNFKLSIFYKKNKNIFIYLSFFFLNSGACLFISFTRQIRRLSYSQILLSFSFLICLHLYPHSKLNSNHLSTPTRYMNPLPNFIFPKSKISLSLIYISTVHNSINVLISFLYINPYNKKRQ